MPPNSATHPPPRALEAEIDGLVYELYALTGDEIAIAEGKK